MNKEMKKNKKMVLALVIVAALAMVSVAAIAIHSDDSAAAGSGQYIPMDSTNPFAIDGTITADYEFYTIGGPDALSIVITSNANYTGTMTIGTLDKSVDPWVYTPYASMKLTNVSNVNITAKLDTKDVAVASFVLVNPITDPINAAQVNTDGVYELNEAPSGTFELLQGSVQLGTGANTFFNGAVTAAGFTVTSEFTYGAVLGISADGKTAQMSGDVVKGTMVNPDPLPTGWTADDFPAATLSLAGAASIQIPDETQKLNDFNGTSVAASLTTSGVEVTVEDGAVITAGDRAPTLAAEVVIEGKDIQEGVLFDTTTGFSVAGDPTDGTQLVFDKVPIGTYSLFISADLGQYWGTATITSTSVSLSGNNLYPNEMAATAFTIKAGDLTFAAGTYTLMSIIDLNTFETGSAKVDNVTSDGIVTFNGISYNGTDTFLAIMKNVGNGLQEVFWGTVGTNNFVDVLSVSTATAPITDGTLIKGGAVTVTSANATILIKDDAVVHIFGELNLLYVNKDQYGVFNIAAGAKVDLNADGGMIIQGVAPPAVGNTGETPVDRIFASANLVAAYYWTNDTSGSPTISTYYLTSLENAIKNSNTVTLVGNVVILKDTTLNSPNSDPLTVIIGPKASLTVGKKGNGVDDPAVSANLTIPSGTSLINPSGRPYKVVNGQAIYDEKPTPKSNEPACDVLITGNNKYIYTDLATALDISTGNATIDTLQVVDELMRSATVNTGVTLNDTHGITIPEDMTLTVNGTVNSTADMTIDGTLMINNVVNFGTASNVILNGSIVIQKDGTLNLKGSTLTGGADSVLVVDGTLNMTGAATGTVTTVTIEGTATITTLKVEGVLRIGAVPDLSTGYTNSASITGKLTLDGAKAIAWIYGSFDAKSAFTNTLISTAYMIDATTYLTIYVSDANADVVAIPMVYGDEFGADGYMLDISINDWNNARSQRGDFLSDNIGKVFIGGDSWTIVYADYSAKQYKVTFNYMPGVTWTCNGQTIDSNNNFAMVDYGASISVQVFVQPGYEGTPVIQKDGTAVSGNPYTMKVTGPVTFSVKDGSVQVAGTGNTDNNSSSGLSLIEILLIIIVIIIAIMAIIIAIRLLRS